MESASATGRGRGARKVRLLTTVVDFDARTVELAQKL
jgi:hypothetical protein